MNEIKTCCFTGHRPQKLPFGYNEEDERCIELKENLKKEIIRQIEENGVTHFITGMALGLDMFAAEAVLELKETYENITLEAAIPCENQCSKWAENLRDRYFSIAEHCDRETLLSTQYTRDCMHKRDRYMVDNSEVIIALYIEGTPGGTKYTVDYARKKGKEIVFIEVGRPDEDEQMLLKEFC